MDTLSHRGNVWPADHGRGRMWRDGNFQVQCTHIKPRRRTVVDHLEADGVGAQSTVGCIGSDAGGVRVVEVNAIGCIEVPQVFNDGLGRVHVIGYGGIQKDRLANSAGIGLSVDQGHRWFFEQGAGEDDDRPGRGHAGARVNSICPRAIAVLAIDQIAGHPVIRVAIPIESIGEMSHFFRQGQSHGLCKSIERVVVSTILVVNERIPVAGKPVFCRLPARIGCFVTVET